VNREGCVYPSKTALPLIVARSTSLLKRSTETVDVYASEFSLGASRLNRLIGDSMEIYPPGEYERCLEEFPSTKHSSFGITYSENVALLAARSSACVSRVQSQSNDERCPFMASNMSASPIAGANYASFDGDRLVTRYSRKDNSSESMRE